MSVATSACSGGGGNDQQSPPPDSGPSATPPSLNIQDATASEGDGTVRVVVRADAASDDEIWVDYATTDGTATAGVDYVSASGTLVFPAGATEQTIDVDLLDDTEAEPEETFSIKLTQPMNAEIDDDVGAVTITDDDTSAACGEPAIDADAGVFVWKDCDLDVWHVRAAAAGSATHYQGSLVAQGSFDQVTAVGTGDDDSVATPSPQRIDFALDVDATTKGFDFQVSADAGTCFGLTAPASGTARLGADRLEVTTPFDLDSLEPCSIDNPPAATDYDVVVIFTDDQRFDTLRHMPEVSSRLLTRGVEFTNAYVPTPLCCPARASTYSGGFLSQNTGVLDNESPNGGMERFNDSVTVGTRLQEIGYRTMFVGKWLNNYVQYKPYVPPGWDRFVGRSVYATVTDWSDFRYVIGSSGSDSSEGSEVGAAGQYNVYFERDQIADFIESTQSDQPFLVFWSTTPPHPPFTPDEPDKDAFSSFTYRGRGYSESDLSDKPQWVQHPGAGDPTGGDDDVRNQLRTLLSVDRSIGTIMDVLAQAGRLDKTIFILTSDNGYMWGEHGLWAKNKSYEESLRVPLLVVMPGVAPRTDDHLVSAVLDLVPTIYDTLGIDAQSDGMSLLPLLHNPGIAWRDELFFEKNTNAQYPNGLWAGLRKDNWKYIHYANGEEELYDLQADPYELENRARDPSFEDVRASMSNRVDELIGLAIRPVRVNTDGAVGEAYSLTLEPWGSESSLTWTVETGTLPPGLDLNASTGEISGTPSASGSWTFSIRLTGSDLATQEGEPKTFVSHPLTIRIT